MAIAAATLAKWAIPIALQMGHSWLQGRDVKKAQKKAEKENKRAQAMSNLINALSPSVRHQPYLQEAEYRPSGLTRALGAAKLGYGAYTGLKGAIAKEAMQKGAQELQDLAIGSAKRKAGQEVGQEYAAKAIRQAKAAGIKPGTEDWNRVTGVISRFGGDREGFGAGAMGALQEYEDTGLNRQALQAQIDAAGDVAAKRAREAAAVKGSEWAMGAMPPGVKPGSEEWDRMESLMTKFGRDNTGFQTGVSSELERLQEARTPDVVEPPVDLSKSIEATGYNMGVTSPHIVPRDIRKRLMGMTDDPALIELGMKAFNEAAMETSLTVDGFIKDSINRGLQTNPALAYEEYSQRMQNLGLASPGAMEEFGQRMLPMLEKTAEVVKLSGETGNRLPRLLFLERELAALDESLSGKSAEQLTEEFGAIQGRINEVQQFFAKGGALEPGTEELLLRLGMTSDMIARVRSGGAINETEMQLYFEQFLGGLSEDPKTLLTRIRTLRSSFVAERRAFFDAAKLERGIVLEGGGEHVPIITSGSSVEALDRTIVRKSTDPSQVPFDYKRIGSAF